MCGYGDTRNEEMTIYLGAYGSYLQLDKEVYNPNNNNEFKESIDKQTMINKIKAKYDYISFINAILECIDNGFEG